MDGSNKMARVSSKGPVSGTGSKAQRGERINRFNMKHIILYPVQVSRFEAHHGTTTTPKATAMRYIKFMEALHKQNTTTHGV